MDHCFPRSQEHSTLGCLHFKSPYFEDGDFPLKIPPFLSYETTVLLVRNIHIVKYKSGVPDQSWGRYRWSLLDAQYFKSWIFHRKLRVPASEGSVLFFVTCSVLCQLSSYNFKTLYGHFPRKFDGNFRPFFYPMDLFETSFKICVKFPS